MSRLACQREAFHLPADYHYFNCAYMGPLPRASEEAGIEAIRSKRMPTSIVPPDAFWETDRLRELFARLVGASDPGRIAIQPGVSYGVATAARNLPVSSGQNIVLTHEQFPGNVYSWRRLAAEAGAQLRAVSAGEGGAGRGRRWNERLLESIDAHTAIVTLPHVHWTDGTRFDLEAIGVRCREVGAALVVDATQSVGALPFDVQAVQPDVLICAAYKWLLGPYTLSLAYFGPCFDDGVPLEETWIARERSSDFQHLVDYQDAYLPGAVRYDMAERSSFFQAPIAAASLELILGWTPEAVQRYCEQLTRELLADLGELGYSVEEGEYRGEHLFGVRMPAAVSLSELRERLSARNVHASLRGTALRLSPHVYNDANDVAVLGEILREAVG